MQDSVHDILQITVRPQSACITAFRNNSVATGDGESGELVISWWSIEHNIRDSRKASGPKCSVRRTRQTLIRLHASIVLWKNIEWLVQHGEG